LLEQTYIVQNDVKNPTQNNSPPSLEKDSKSESEVTSFWGSNMIMLGNAIKVSSK